MPPLEEWDDDRGVLLAIAVARCENCSWERIYLDGTADLQHYCPTDDCTGSVEIERCDNSDAIPADTDDGDEDEGGEDDSSYEPSADTGPYPPTGANAP